MPVTKLAATSESLMRPISVENLDGKDAVAVGLEVSADLSRQAAHHGSEVTVKLGAQGLSVNTEFSFFVKPRDKGLDLL